MNSDVEESLFRMRLRRKYSAVIIQETKENLSLLKSVRDFVAFGPIDEKTLHLLLEKRAKPIGNKKMDIKLIVEELHSQAKKGKIDLASLGVKPFFRLHPPIKGIDSKIHFGRKKGVLGDNKEKINDLVRRML